MAQEGQLILRSSQPIDILCCFKGLIYLFKQDLFMCSSCSSTSSRKSGSNSNSSRSSSISFLSIRNKGNLRNISDCVARQNLNLCPCLVTFSAFSKTVPFSLLLLLVHCEFQSSVCFSMDSSSFLQVLPI